MNAAGISLELWYSSFLGIENGCNHVIVVTFTEMMATAAKWTVNGICASEPTTMNPAKKDFCTPNQFYLTIVMFVIVVVFFRQQNPNDATKATKVIVVSSTVYLSSSKISLCTELIFHHSIIHATMHLLEESAFCYCKPNVPRCHMIVIHIDIKHQKSTPIKIKKKTKTKHELPTICRHENNHFAEILCSAWARLSLLCWVFIIDTVNGTERESESVHYHLFTWHGSFCVRSFIDRRDEWITGVRE